MPHPAPRSEELYQLLFEKSPVGVFHYDPSLVITDCNPRFASILQSTPDRLLGLDMHLLRDQSIMDALLAPISGEEGVYEGLYRATTSEALIWTSIRTAPLFDAAGQVTGCVGIVEDITDRRKAEEELLHETITDSLTGLPNRTLFLDRVSQAIQRVERGAHFGVLMVDLDRFKVVNDGLGHMVGDALLVEAAHRLESILWPGDTVARMGGDEFAILLDSMIDVTTAIEVATKIHDAFAQPFYPLGAEAYTSASIGIVTSDRHYDGPHEVLRDADAAMYRAKAAGGARHELFDAVMHREALHLFEIEGDLRRGVERGEFVLDYQPIVSLASGTINGFEALIRWEHPTKGLIQPGDFIGVAEETGLIVPMGRWALIEACRQMREWKDLFPGAEGLAMTVNVSGRQFERPDFIDVLTEALKSSGLDAESLALELTETVLLEVGEVAKERLNRIADLGVRLLLDDFGTGYSSLRYLHRLPIDALKIDGSFIEGILTDSTNLEIVKTILALADHLRMDVIAEGIESEEQRTCLMELECTSAQGFHFSPPVSAAMVPLLIKAGTLPQT